MREKVNILFLVVNFCGLLLAGNCAQIDSLQQDAIKLKEIIHNHFTRGETKEAEEASAVLVRLQKRIASHVQTTAEKGFKLAKNSLEYSKIEGGAKNLKYDTIQTTFTAAQHLSATATPLSLRLHFLPAFSWLYSCFSLFARNETRNYIDISAEIRQNVYQNGWFSENDSSSNDLNYTTRQNIWNIAISEAAACVVVFLMFVAGIFLILRCFCGISLSRVHRYLSILLAIPLLTTSITGALWMICDQVRFYFKIHRIQNYFNGTCFKIYPFKINICSF